MNTSEGSKLLRIKEVSNRTSLAKSTISLWVAQGRFPAPTKLSPTIKVWSERDIERWITEHFGVSSEGDCHGGK